MKYGRDVDNAIAEACARREPPSEVLVRLRAGTLPGIDRPVPEIADRTFWGKWSRARDRQRQGAPGDDGPSILDMIAADLMRRGELDGPAIEDPDEIAKRLGVDPKQVGEWLEEFEKSEELVRQREQRPDPLAERAARIKRGRAMIAEGVSREEAAEAMEMPLYEAQPYLDSALAEQAEREQTTTAAGSRNGAGPGS